MLQINYYSFRCTNSDFTVVNHYFNFHPVMSLGRRICGCSLYTPIAIIPLLHTMKPKVFRSSANPILQTSAIGLHHRKTAIFTGFRSHFGSISRDRMWVCRFAASKKGAARTMLLLVSACASRHFYNLQLASAFTYPNFIVN